MKSFKTSTKYLKIVTYFLVILLLGSTRDILTQIQFGADETTITSPIISASDKTVDITFENSYSDPPTVLIYLTSISVLKSNLQNYKVEVTNITEKGFKLAYSVQLNGETVSLKVSWFAFEATSVAEVIYKEINGVNLSDSSLSVTTRNDVFPINFKNTYTEAPNVALFFLGLASKEDSVDTVNLGYSDITMSSCQVSVSSWSSGMLEKVSFAVFVMKNSMSISQSGKQSTIKSGQIDTSSVWMDTTKTNRILSTTQTSTSKLTAQTEDGYLVSSLTGFKGYDVRQNLSTNLKINLAQFDTQTFKQSVETWNQSQVVAGYWDSIAINSTTNSLSSLEDSSGFAWWLILIIFLVVVIAIVLVVLLIIYCERKKKRQAKEAEEQANNAKEEVKEDNNKNQNDISENDSKNQDQSILKSKMNQDNTQSIMIKDRKDVSLIYNDDYIQHKDNQPQNTKRDNDNISYLNNTNFMSPKNNITENNLESHQTAKIIDLDGIPVRPEQSSTILIKSKANGQQSNEESNLHYYRNPRKQYENINHLKDEEDDKIQQILDNREVFYTVPITSQQQQKQNIPQQQQQNGMPSKQQSNIQKEQESIPMNQQENKHSEMQKQHSNQQQNQQPIDRTLKDIDLHINNYKKDQQIQDLNQSQVSQDVDQTDELRQMKKSNYDVYRQILLNKQKFDNQQRDPSPGVSPNLTHNPELNTNNNSSNNYNNNNSNTYYHNHILNNRYNLGEQPLHSNSQTNNIYSNSSTYRPLQYSSRMEEQQQSQQNTHQQQQGRIPMSQIGNMIVSGNNDITNENNKKRNHDVYQPHQSQKLNSNLNGMALNTADSIYKNENSLNTYQRGSDYLSVEDEDMPRRPKDNNIIPLV